MDIFKRLVIVTHEFEPFHGGMATYVENISKETYKNNIETIVIAPKYFGIMRQHPYVVKRKLKHQRLKLSSFIYLFAIFIKNDRTTYWHAADVRSAILLYFCQLISNRQYGVTIHGSDVLKLQKRGLRSFIAKAAYRNASHIFSNSIATSAIFTRTMHHSDLRVTHLGLSEEFFKDPDEEFENKGLEDFVHDGSVILTVGRIEERKGHHAVLAALKDLYIEGEIIKYVVVGPTVDYKYKRELEEFSKKANLKVYFTGVISNDELRRLYAKCTCHVLFAQEMSDKIEGFGLVVLEAAAQRCITIATAVGGLPEVIEDGKTGFLIDPNSTEQLRSAIKKVASSPQNYENMGKMAQEEARLFTWSRCIKTTYGDILQEI